MEIPSQYYDIVIISVEPSFDMKLLIHENDII